MLTIDETKYFSVVEIDLFSCIQYIPISRESEFYQIRSTTDFDKIYNDMVWVGSQASIWIW